MLGNFNARMSKEGTLSTRVSLHDETVLNGLRVIDSNGARNIVVCRTRIQHKKINQATWLSPDRSDHEVSKTHLVTKKERVPITAV